MIRVDVMLPEEQLSYLQSLKGNVSEHIRRAIDEYIVKVKNHSATTSPSDNSKKGGENARSSTK